MTREVQGVLVHGIDVDPQTRCAHYNTELDVIAIRFACCDKWYPCYECHKEVADHQIIVWPISRFEEKSVLCGVCGHQLNVDEYLKASYRCLSCSAPFNPGCAHHRDLYFATE